MIIAIPDPDDSAEYTHIGEYCGPKGQRFTTGVKYNLIYEDITNSVSVRNDRGTWFQVDGDFFHVTHNYKDPSLTPPKGCDAVVSVVGEDPGFDDDIQLEAEVTPIPDGPASTAELRKYRFKPNLF